MPWREALSAVALAALITCASAQARELEWTGPWKAMMVLFTTSPTRPMGMIVLRFNHTFATREDCEAMVSDARERLKTAIASYRLPPGVKVLHHNLSCIEDRGGEGA